MLLCPVRGCVHTRDSVLSRSDGGGEGTNLTKHSPLRVFAGVV